MILTEALITENVDVNMSVLRSVGNLESSGLEFREMWLKANAADGNESGTSCR
jgi:hypothetical protein